MRGCGHGARIGRDRRRHARLRVHGQGPRERVADHVAATVELAAGAVGTLEASRVCRGRKNSLVLEVNGSKGSLAFDLERLNELRLDRASSPPSRAEGFRTVLVTEADHPFWEHWWPAGHVIGWEHTFVHELHHLRAS